MPKSVKASAGHAAAVAAIEADGPERYSVTDELAARVERLERKVDKERIALAEAEQALEEARHELAASLPN